LTYLFMLIDILGYFILILCLTRKTGLPNSIVKIVEYECNGCKGRPGNLETIFVEHADFITFDSMAYLNTSSIDPKNIV
jgi:hypothetical protein